MLFNFTQSSEPVLLTFSQDDFEPKLLNFSEEESKPGNTSSCSTPKKVAEATQLLALRMEDHQARAPCVQFYKTVVSLWKRAVVVNSDSIIACSTSKWGWVSGRGGV